MHAVLHQRGPAYLSNRVNFNAEESGRRHLRSSTTNAAVVMRTRTQFGKRAFSACGPSVWNQFLLTPGTFILLRVAYSFQDL